MARGRVLVFPAIFPAIMAVAPNSPSPRAKASTPPERTPGTALGIIAGNLLPLRAVSALSVALYGMFLAIIIPPARKSRVVAALVAISFALSFVCNDLPGISALSEGTRTILLTVLISSAAAVLFPVNREEQEAGHDA